MGDAKARRVAAKSRGASIESSAGAEIGPRVIASSIGGQHRHTCALPIDLGIYICSVIRVHVLYIHACTTSRLRANVLCFSVEQTGYVPLRAAGLAGEPEINRRDAWHTYVTCLRRHWPGADSQSSADSGPTRPGSGTRESAKARSRFENSSIPVWDVRCGTVLRHWVSIKPAARTAAQPFVRQPEAPPPPPLPVCQPTTNTNLAARFPSRDQLHKHCSDSMRERIPPNMNPFRKKSPPSPESRERVEVEAPVAEPLNQKAPSAFTDTDIPMDSWAGM